MKAPDEITLTHKRWFSYRHLTPRQADAVFMRAYGNAFANHSEKYGYGRHRNCFKSCGPRCLAMDCWGTCRNSKPFVRARHKADALCAEYDNFWALVFKAAQDMNYSKFFLNVLTSKKVLDRAADYWLERTTTQVVWSQHWSLQAVNYTGTIHQRAYFRHILRSLQMIYPANQVPGMVGNLANEGHIPLRFLNDLAKGKA